MKEILYRITRQLARFRTGRCGEAVEDLFYQYVNLLEKQGETDHETVFVDGTKLESRAGRYTFCWRGSVEKHLAKVREKVLELTGLKKLAALHIYLEQRKENIAFAHGKGSRKSEEQRNWESLDELRQKWERYETALRIMGDTRNSYSKTDPDATFIAEVLNPMVRGWMNYFGRYNRSAMKKGLDCVQRRLIRWAMCKYKHFRGHRQRAEKWLNQIKKREPKMFAHWVLS